MDKQQIIDALDLCIDDGNAPGWYLEAMEAARDKLAASAPNPSDKQEAVAEGFETIQVKNFLPFVEAVERAIDKGYMPDAMMDSWVAFEFSTRLTPPAQSAEQEAKPAGYVNAAWAENRIGTTTVYPESRPRLATMPLFTHPTPDDAR